MSAQHDSRRAPTRAHKLAVVCRLCVTRSISIKAVRHMPQQACSIKGARNTRHARYRYSDASTAHIHACAQALMLHTQSKSLHYVFCTHWSTWYMGHGATIDIYSPECECLPYSYSSNPVFSTTAPAPAKLDGLRQPRAGSLVCRRLVSCTIAVLCDDLCWLGRRLEGHGSGQSSYLLAIWSTRGKGRGPQQLNGQKPYPPLPNRRGRKPWSILGAHPLCSFHHRGAARERGERRGVCGSRSPCRISGAYGPDERPESDETTRIESQPK